MGDTQTQTIDSFAKVRQNKEAAFNSYWTQYGVPRARQDGGAWITPAYNRGPFEKRIRADRSELDERGLEDAPVFRGMAMHGLSIAAAQAAAGDGVDAESLESMRRHNIIDRNVVETSTPLVFDPDVLELLKAGAPLAFERVTRRGQEGFDAVFNRVDDREQPLGKVPEAVATRLQDFARDFNLERQDVPMTIYADTAEISDFSAQAAAHYMNLEDLAIGSRMAEWSLFHEQEMLYGDPSVALEGGSPVGPYANEGISTWFDGAGQSVDKTTVTSEILEDIKWEIRQILQGPFASMPQDLEVWMSWELFDFLENEFTNIGARFLIDVSDLDFGDYNLSVGGIPVHPSHNIDEHTYIAQDEDGDIQDPWDPYDPADADFAEETVGSSGDVFIVNSATFEVRELAPLSTFPLAVRGAADEVAMVQYGAFVELSGGNFGKYLSNYADGALSPTGA